MFDTITMICVVLFLIVYTIIMCINENAIKEERRKYLDTLTLEEKAKILQYENLGKYRLFRKKNKNAKK